MRPWIKGKSGNPSGRPAIPAELRAIKSLTKDEIGKIVAKYARMTRDEMIAALQDLKTPVMELAIAKILIHATDEGDHQRLAFLLDRAIGKVDAIAPGGDDEIEELQDLSDEELVRRVKEQLAG